MISSSSYVVVVYLTCIPVVPLDVRCCVAVCSFEVNEGLFKVVVVEVETLTKVIIIHMSDLHSPTFRDLKHKRCILFF